MSVFRKFLTTAVAATALLTSPAFAQEDVRIALVVKALGIGFFEAAAKGAEEAAAELGNVEYAEGEWVENAESGEMEWHAADGSVISQAEWAAQTSDGVQEEAAESGEDEAPEASEAPEALESSDSEVTDGEAEGGDDVD